jgi:hypothetical protein
MYSARFARKDEIFIINMIRTATAGALSQLVPILIIWMSNQDAYPDM